MGRIHIKIDLEFFFYFTIIRFRILFFLIQIAIVHSPILSFTMLKIETGACFVRENLYYDLLNIFNFYSSETESCPRKSTAFYRSYTQKRTKNIFYYCAMRIAFP